MANHVKPTKEELRANAEAALKKLETLPPEGSEEDQKSTPQEIPEEKEAREKAEAEEARIAEEKRLADEEAENAGGEETPEEKEAREKAEAEEKRQVDWKKRYTDSTREAIVLSTKNKELNKVIEDAAQITEPTEEEMKKEYAEWDEMTTTEQRLAKNDLLNRKRFELIHGATQRYKQVDDWNEKVDSFVEDPKTLIANPELEGKTQEFRIFAGKPTRVGMDFDDLVLAFMGDEAKKVKPNHKGQKMFENGTGGSKQSPKPPSDKLTLLQGAALRKSNYPEYRRLLKAGKIDNE